MCWDFFFSCCYHLWYSVISWSCFATTWLWGDSWKRRKQKNKGRENTVHIRQGLGLRRPRNFQKCKVIMLFNVTWSETWEWSKRHKSKNAVQKIEYKQKCKIQTTILKSFFWVFLCCLRSTLSTFWPGHLSPSSI